MECAYELLVAVASCQFPVSSSRNSLRLILQSLHSRQLAAGERGRLLLIERALTTDDPLETAIRDLSMLVLLGGQSRSVEEHEALLRRAGFSVERTLASPSGYCLLEARPESDEHVGGIHAT